MIQLKSCELVGSSGFLGSLQLGKWHWTKTHKARFITHEKPHTASKMHCGCCCMDQISDVRSKIPTAKKRVDAKKNPNARHRGRENWLSKWGPWMVYSGSGSLLIHEDFAMMASAESTKVFSSGVYSIPRTSFDRVLLMMSNSVGSSPSASTVGTLAPFSLNRWSHP